MSKHIWEKAFSNGEVQTALNTSHTLEFAAETLSLMLDMDITVEILCRYYDIYKEQYGLSSLPEQMLNQFKYLDTNRSEMHNNTNMRNIKMNWKSFFEEGHLRDTLAKHTSLTEAIEEIRQNYTYDDDEKGSNLKRAYRRYRRELELPNDINDLLNSSKKMTADDLSDVDKYVLPKDTRRHVGDKPIVEFSPKDGERWVVISDVHHGIQDDKSLELMVRCSEDFGVQKAIQVGDFWDCYSISRHDKQADRIRGKNFTLADEARESKPLMDWMATRELGATIIPGNHEDRVFFLENNNLGLHNSLDLRNIFGVPSTISILPQYGRIVAGSLVIEHGHKLRRPLGRTVTSNVLADYPDQTTIFGHTHKIQESRHTTMDKFRRPRTRMALTIGHLSQSELHFHYAPDANWQQGFALIEFWRGRGGKLRYTIYPVEIHDHEFSFNGKVYR
jgi:predicted phosphodiesterase